MGKICIKFIQIFRGDFEHINVGVFAGIMFQDITTLLLDPKAFKDTIDLFVDRYKGKSISVVAGIYSQLRDPSFFSFHFAYYTVGPFHIWEFCLALFFTSLVEKVEFFGFFNTERLELCYHSSL